MTPAVGDLDGDGLLELAYATREGNLFVWRTPGQACAGQEWPKYQHDLRNTGTYGVDARPPSRILNLTGPGIGRTVTWTATGDDMKCGRAASYDVRASSVPVTDANWATATQLRNEPVPGARDAADVQRRARRRDVVRGHRGDRRGREPLAAQPVGVGRHPLGTGHTGSDRPSVARRLH